MQSAKNYSYESYNNDCISYFTDSFVDKIGINNLIRASLTGWPEQSAIFLGILVGVNLLVNGFVALLLGFKITAIESA
jgi:hypothetical protein